eukprot:3012138-Rhodomonas_salina.1
MFAYIVGSISTVATTTNLQEQKLRDRMRELHEYLNIRKIPKVCAAQLGAGQEDVAFGELRRDGACVESTRRAGARETETGHVVACLIFCGASHTTLCGERRRCRTRSGGSACIGGGARSSTRFTSSRTSPPRCDARCARERETEQG